MSIPALSVVVASVNGAGALQRCLRSLESGAEPIEVIVVADSGGAAQAGEIAGRVPGTDVVRLEGRRTIPELRSVGIRRARAAVVAILADYYAADWRWPAAVLSSHRRHPGAAIGGAVENGGPDRIVDWVAYLTEYARFMLPFEECPSTELAGPNASYDRVMLERECSDLLDRGAWDHVVHERLAARGVPLWRDPSIVAFYGKRLTAAEFLQQRYRFGRSYAAARALPSGRRALLAAAAPAVVVLQLWRIASRLLASPRTRRWLVPGAPLFVLSAIAWSAGESAGYALGDGSASLAVR